MTKKQNIYYWRSWSPVKKILENQGVSKDDIESCRKEIHLLVTGVACSSKSLKNHQLDKVLARFNALAAPSNGAAQARAAEQPLKRVLWKINQLAANMKLTKEYINGMALKINSRPLEHCDQKQLIKILAALNLHQKRNKIKL